LNQSLRSDSQALEQIHVLPDAGKLPRPPVLVRKRIANRSLSDFFIGMFTKYSRRQNQGEEACLHATSLQKQALLREVESFGKNFMEIARADLL
jgi:hypothetical protein